MQKAKLGISVGFLGALLYLSGLFSGYIITIVLAGYVLIAEENAWLRKTAVKAVTLMVSFSVLYALVGLLPDLIGVIDSLIGIFGGNLYIAFIGNLVTFIRDVIDLAELLIFLLLGLNAFSMGTVKLPVIDKLIEKHMN